MAPTPRHNRMTSPSKQGYGSPTRRGYRRFYDDPSFCIIDGAGPREKFPRPPGLLTSEVIYSDVPPRDGATSPSRKESPNGEADKSAARHFVWNTLDSILLKPAEVASNFPIPLATICTPFYDGADSGSLATSDPGSEDPLRCPRCRSYANPFFRWSSRDNTKFQCNMCLHHLEVPKEFLEDLDRAGQTADEERHPELVHGSVDHIAPGHLDVDRPLGPTAPAVIFLVEASADAVASGLYNTTLEALEQLLADPDSQLRRRVCLITYDACLQFFAPTRSGRFRRIVVSTIEERQGEIRDEKDPFAPLAPAALFVDVGDDDNRADFLDLLRLLQQDEFSPDSPASGGCPSPIGRSNSSSGALIPKCSIAGDALRAAVEVLTGVGGGDIMLLHASSPSAGLGAPIASVLPEKTVAPQCASFYQETLALCTKGGVAVNVVTAPAPGKQMDLETLQWLTWRTGGDSLHLPSFTPAYLNQLEQHFKHWAGKMQGSAYSCVVKLRLSKGLQCNGLVAPWSAAPGSSDGSAFELPRMSADTSFVFKIKPEYDYDTDEDPYYSHRRDDKRKQHYVQVAVLYTNVKGDRLLRLHTTSIAIAANVRSVFQAASIGPLMNYLVKVAAATALESKPGSKITPRDFLLEFLLQMLSMYQRHCYSSEVGIKSLVVNKRLNLLPLYVLGARKLLYSVMGSGDGGNEFLRKLLRMPIHSILAALYPRVYPVAMPEPLSEGESAQEGSTSPLQIPVKKRSQEPKPGELPAPLAPMQDSVAKAAWPAYIITNGLGAWLYRTPEGDAAILETREEVEKFRGTAESVVKQLQETLEPSPLPMPLAEICNLSTATEESREQKVFMATLFVEDEGFTEMSYADWIQFLQGQVMKMSE